ncbi:hypothetical protein NECAME_15804 [Necator americanus]|uniref:Uncharacterized protein n=1 Tax=Necator americanus TaxID=51031 RepID=W2SFS1_NECAM|nr:hypothetical protein NECAME_15804 [Necator americanus]ETN68464.1 hypothetical protein NECAME_15804 [Necator americanus]
MVLSQAPPVLQTPSGVHGAKMVSGPTVYSYFDVDGDVVNHFSPLHDPLGTAAPHLFGVRSLMREASSTKFG